ncbi:MAG: VOC family protein [Rhodococcus sp.]|nr:VOC family protein [Rhodococcus sp. (in: high G+C Gram-positive bacteria)]
MEILSSRTILRPKNYSKTLAFYRETLGLATAREYPGGTVLFAGQGLIEIAAHGGRGESTRFDGALWLQVRDLTAVQTGLVLAGVQIAREARQEPWGLHEMWISDPDGVQIVLVQIPDDHPIRLDSRPPETG